eukprot:TRINITY_DN5334_c0_g3_i7.p1 TRINITY_DN5334_c0_g3~~TRINITY_DN5334_c0_g3_i7.p1  ORF type:complete len:172 (+),score=53.35 TRINITY_DN5334_c0_g3_i7:61-576(+)
MEDLYLLTERELELLVCGQSTIDIDLLRETTRYMGNVTAEDTHVRYLWSVLEQFDNSQRQAFLQFVWGRTRLPPNKLAFGRDGLLINEHAPSMHVMANTVLDQAGNRVTPDSFLPVSHTCFFALDLPRYSSEEVLRTRLLYAISNCSTIDADATAEGRLNVRMSVDDDDED